MTTKSLILSNGSSRSAAKSRGLWWAGALLFFAVLLARRLDLPPGYSQVGSALLVTASTCAVIVKLKRSHWNLPDVARSAAALSLLIVISARYMLDGGLAGHLWLVLLAVVAVGIHLVNGSMRAWSELRSAGGAPRRWERALAHIIPARLAVVACTELRMLSYAVAWRTPPTHPVGFEAFSYHRNMMPMLLAFLALAAIEAIVLHLLVSLWSTTAAWVLFVVSDVSVIYLLGLMNSMRKLPLLVSTDGLRVNAGLLIGFWLPMPAIAGLYPTPAEQPIDKSRILKATLLSTPNVYLRLVKPIEIPGPFGRRRLVEAVGLHPDDLAAFSKSVTQARHLAVLGARAANPIEEQRS